MRKITDEGAKTRRLSRSSATRGPLWACGILLLTLAACGEEKQASSDAPSATPPLAVLTLTPQKASREQIWDGVIEAVNEATMSAQTAGQVVELPFDVNDFVPAGSLIVRLSDVEQRAAVRQAQASADEAQAQYQRIEQLYEKRVVSKASLDQALTRREATLAALHTAQQQLEYTTIKAPYAGYVTKRFVRLGEEVQPAQPLIAGVSLDTLRVAVEVPQSAAPAIRKFGKAEIFLEASGAKRQVAKTVTIFPYADPVTHSFTVRADLPEAEAGLYPGMTVKVAFQIGEAERLQAPVSALFARGEFSGVYVVSGEHVSLRQLRLGHIYGDQIEVLAGIDAGEQIAADPVAAASYLTNLHKGSVSP